MSAKAEMYLVIRNSSDQYVVNDTFKNENFKDVCNFVVMLYSGKQAQYWADHNVNVHSLANEKCSESCNFEVLCNSTQGATDALDAFKQQHAYDNVLVWDSLNWYLFYDKTVHPAYVHNGEVMFMNIAKAMKAVLKKHNDMIKVNMWCLFKYGHNCYAWESCLDAVCSPRSKIFTDGSHSYHDFFSC